MSVSIHRSLSLLSVLQKWRQTASSQIDHFCSYEQREREFPLEGLTIDGALEAAGLTARLYIIKLPPDRSFSLTSLTKHPPPGRLVARLLWEESLARVSLLGFPKSKTRQKQEEVQFVFTLLSVAASYYFLLASMSLSTLLLILWMHPNTKTCESATVRFSGHGKVVIKQSECLHDTRENQITGSVRLWSDF